VKTIDIIERAIGARDRLLADPRVLHAEITGSVRRGLPEVGDLDLLVVTRDPWSFQAQGAPAREPEHQADLFLATPETYGAALAYSTGPRTLNRRLRQLAFERSLLLDFASPATDGLPEIKAVHGPLIGLYSLAGRLVPTPTEESFFKEVGVAYVPPPWREWLAEHLR
jgi:DNA polymerase/3'-5' exonuclease PolX